jgi:hypothetical protein
MKAVRSSWAAVALITAFAATGWAAGLPEAALDVRVTSGRLSVRASAAPLADVLQAVGRAAHLNIVVHGGIDNVVNDEFFSLPLDDAVRRLTRWYSVVLIYRGQHDDPTNATLAEVWVTGARSNRAAEHGGMGAEGMVRSTELATRPASSPREHEPDLRPPGLTMALRSGPSDSRTQIINALVQERGEYAVIQILRQAATRDANPRIRRGAIQVLMSLKSPDAIEAIQASVHDEHPGVRGEAETALRRLRRAQMTD